MRGQTSSRLHAVPAWEQGRGYRKRRMDPDGTLPHQVDLLEEVRLKAGETVPFHFHRNQTEIFFVLALGLITIDGVAVEAREGDVIVCEPGDVHGMPHIENDFGLLVMKIDYDSDDTVWL